MIEKNLVVELEAIAKILLIHKVQVLTYKKLLKILIGLMLNFYVTHIFKEGQKTYINERYRIQEE